MRKLSEITPPLSFKHWLQSQQNAGIEVHYNMLSGALKNDLKSALLENQGYLCAYTEIRLDTPQACHIEHIVPQTQAPELDLSLTNLAACFPASGGDAQSGYGAPIKGGTAVRLNQNFISPYANTSVFSYNAQGHIKGQTSAADRTIQILNLNHSSLCELRERAIQIQGLSLRKKNLRSKIPLGRPLSASQARALAQSLQQPDSHGKLPPFCSALAQVAEQYADNEEKRAQRLKKRKAR